MSVREQVVFEARHEVQDVKARIAHARIVHREFPTGSLSRGEVEEILHSVEALLAILERDKPSER